MKRLRSSTNTRLSITPQPNQFDDHFLDIVGKDFRFDHPKGIAEWIKNSADAYSTTARVPDTEQYIFLRFHEAKPKANSIFECIDFVGMTKDDIDKALKVWGLKTAAKKGTNIATYGGHGNGGKFYMRQMFQNSQFITFRGGRLNVFGFDDKKRYGFAKGLEEKTCTLEEALTFAGIDSLDIPKCVLERWKKNRRTAGFTVARGTGPHRFRAKATVATIVDKLRIHPQARRLLAHKQVFVIAGSKPKRLEPLTVVPRPGFEKPIEIRFPKSFKHGGETFEFHNAKHPGKLVLRTSEYPLTRMSGLNAIDILGKVGCIGSYQMSELGFMKHGPEAEFIYGECECPLLEDRECVRNDREKLVENELTLALREWIRHQVDSLAEKMAEKRQEEKKDRDLQQSSLFNQLLDKWKNQFMVKLTAELFGGSGLGDSFGGSGGGGNDSTYGDGDRGGQGDRQKMGDDGDGGGGGDQTRRGPRFPRVLLSGKDRDPLNEDAAHPFECDPRHPPIYQRDVDVEHGIYWINTSRPLASKLLDQYSASSPRWREYLFQRYVDIITKQSVYELNKRDLDFTADKIDRLIDDVTARVHDAAATDLEQFLFSDAMTATAAAAAK